MKKLPMAIFKIPLRNIDKVYGRDNHDNAGDDLIYILTKVESYTGQLQCNFEFDSSHTNPWFHVLVFDVYDCTEKQTESISQHISNLDLEYEYTQIEKSKY